MTEEHGSAPRRSARSAPIRATPVLIAACVLVWLIQLVADDWVIEHLAFSPAWAAQSLHTTVTTAFVHSTDGGLHLMFNMIGLYFFGTFLERFMGTGWFVLLYLFSAFCGSLAVFALAVVSSDPQALLTAHIGASGAIFGLVGFVATPTRRLDRNITGVIAFVAINVVLIWLLPGISWQSHLGGFIAGFVFGCGYFFTPARWRTGVLIALTAGVTAAGAAVMMVPVLQ